MSAVAALAVAAALAGCGTTTYFANRTLPPSGLRNRVLIAVQNPSAGNKGSLLFVDAYYDTRYVYNNITKTFSISGFGGALPTTIQNMPEEQAGAVYSAGDGSLSLISYSQEKQAGAEAGLAGPSYSSVFVTRSQSYAFGASERSGALVIVDGSSTGGTFTMGLPGVYRVSVNPGGSVALAFVENSDYMYYPVKLTAAQSANYSGGQTTWPPAAVDCEPRTQPKWCVFQAQSPDTLDSKTQTYYGAPLQFDRPVKAVFSSDGGTAYVLNCGPECGGKNASVSLMPVAPMIFLLGLGSGQLPSTSTLSSSCGQAGVVTSCTIPTPGGASNALISSSTMYLVGQQLQQDGFWGGQLTRLDLTANAVVASTASSPNPVSISDGAPGAVSRMIIADDNTLWIGMTKCTGGERYNNPGAYPGGYGCLTMFNTSTNTVTLLEPYIGDLTGIAAVTGLNKIYVAQGGQVYIYKTADGTAINNQYVTVTGTAWDVAYMDANSDSDNTVY
jgi:hypothetical protein